jgi:hypothetical protein
MEKIITALDIAASCSDNEGVPDAIGECMPCGVPRVAADVEDSGETVVAVFPVMPAILLRHVKVGGAA